jgi:hypothetical protein
MGADEFHVDAASNHRLQRGIGGRLAEAVETADRGCHRRGGPEPNTREWTPEIPPRPTWHRVAARAWVISPSIRRMHQRL